MRHRVVAAACLIFCTAITILLATNRSASAQDPNWSLRGRWTTTIPDWSTSSADRPGTHVAVLRGVSDTTWVIHRLDGSNERVWMARPMSDSSMGVAVPLPNKRLFCAGQVQLADGRLLVVGGTTTQHTGLGGANLFDPKGFRQDAVNHGWIPQHPMSVGRWYPTATRLADGSILAGAGHRYFQMNMFGGRDSGGVTNDAHALTLSSDPLPRWNADPTVNDAVHRPVARDGQAGCFVNTYG